MLKMVYSLLLALYFLLTPFPLVSGERTVKMGVLAKRGPELVHRRWQPTADYLGTVLPGYDFQIIPLGFDEIHKAVQESRIDFVLANPAFYVELEKRHGVNRIATLINNHITGEQTTVFGGVIFSRADRHDIVTLEDFRSKSFMAVEARSFGGWLMAWREFDRQGIKPDNFFSLLKFGNTHDAVVFAVRDGLVDGGTVRTDTLERMAEEGTIDLADFRTINHQKVTDFPFLLSTELYPEWPMAAVRTTPARLSRLVASALMAMEEDTPASHAANIAGWTVPLNYQPVHDCLLALRISPYDNYGVFTLKDVILKYWVQTLLLLAGLLAISIITLYIVHLNRDLSQKKAEVEELNQNLEDKVLDRTQKIESLLEREMYLREILRTVADINELLITSQDLQQLLLKACSRFTRHSYYGFSWIGLLRENSVESIYTSGGEHLTAALSLDKKDGAELFFKSPTAQCLTDNMTVVQPYLGDSLGFKPPDSGDETDELKWIIALPLRPDQYSVPIGALTVYTWRHQGFEAEEISMLEELAGDLGFAISAFGHRQAVVQLENERTENYEETILSFVNMIDHRDTYTAGHTLRVAHYCQLIAREMGYGEADIAVIKKAAILHDIGKIATPDSVLLKPGTLEAPDYDLIKLHASAGFEMLSNVKMYKNLAEIIHQHHERHDGLGYPRGLSGENIHPLARIMSVADAFDAMTTNRIYKPRKELQDALAELDELRGIQFHPAVVDAAAKVLRDISVVTSIDQLPVTDLERKRFAYFFNDKLTGLYNEDYLQIILLNNEEHFEYSCVNTLHPLHLETYNRNEGWEKGNLFLRIFADELLEQYPESMVFRAFGNDFIVLSKEHNGLTSDKVMKFEAFKDVSVQIEVTHVDLHKDQSYTTRSFEKMGMMAGRGSRHKACPQQPL